MDIKEIQEQAYQRGLAEGRREVETLRERLKGVSGDDVLLITRLCEYLRNGGDRCYLKPSSFSNCEVEAKKIVSCEGEKVFYMELPDGLRLIIREGKYVGWYVCNAVPDGKDTVVPTKHGEVKGVEIDQFNKWIPVTERLPDEAGTPVLVSATNCYDQTHIVKAFLDYDAPDFFRTNEKEYDGTWGAWEVTHWMPLPEPPED